MTFDEYVNEIFQDNLLVAREEVELDTNNNDIEDLERRAWRFAVEWTQDDIASRIGSSLEQRWWKQQDGINKVFYE